MEIIQKITWIPHNLKSKFAPKKEDPILLDLRRLGITKTFKLYTLKKDLGLTDQLKTFGFREPLNLRYSHDFIRKNDKVLDIGANIGLFSLLSHNAKEIISVEPIKECLPILRKNLEENGLSKKTKVINLAVGKEGKLILKKEEKVNLSRVVKEKEKNTVEVTSKPLKHFIKKFGSNVLRIDVEGYEYEILYKKIPKGINKIAMEFHTALLGERKIKVFLNYFEKEGFIVKYLIEDLPLRLYPFYDFLKKTSLIKLFTYVKRNLSPIQCYHHIKKGRTIKYLFLER